MDIVSQIEGTRVSGSTIGPAADSRLRLSLLGQAFTADWKHHMVSAGRAFRLSFGQITGGADIVWNDGVAVMNLDQPQGFITADAGLALIPMEIDIALQADMDAFDDEQEIVVTVDRTQAVPAGGTFVEATANLATAGGASIANLLDGGAVFGGRSAASITGDIIDPVHSSVLGYKLWEITQIAAQVEGRGIEEMSLYKSFYYAEVIKGDCTILLYVAGTNASLYGGSITFGAVPSEWYPLS